MKAVSVKTQNGTGKLLKWLEGLYEKYNRREYVHPDPVELLYAYGDVRDRPALIPGKASAKMPKKASMGRE